MNNYLKSIGKNALKAFKKKIDTKIKNKVLNQYANSIKKNKYKIINQNNRDIKLAKKKGITENLLQRLSLNSKKIDQIIKSIKIISKLKDPTNVIMADWFRPNGLRIKRVSIPMGIIGVIYESRPNVTSDFSWVCF